MLNHINAWTGSARWRVILIGAIFVSVAALTWLSSSTAMFAKLAALPTGALRSTATKTITFSNDTWHVRSGMGGPGPNIWDDTNAWVDAGGNLHLKLTNVAGTWHSVEISTQDRLGFGTYQFDVIGAIDQFDPNIVLGLYNYPPPDVGPDGTNEIDIEFARWGAASHPNGNYTVWPAQAGLQRSTRMFEFALGSITTTHQFVWTPQSIAFQSAQGLASDNAPSFASWSYQPAAFDQYIPQQAMPLHLNLWLFQGAAPANGQEVEIVITKFTFTPLMLVYLPIMLK